MSDIYNSKIAKVVGWLNGNKTGYAVTISSTCTLYSCDKEHVDFNPQWRGEENNHKEQIKHLGWFGFMTTYLWQMLTKGYKRSQLEIDAKKEAGRS